MSVTAFIRRCLDNGMPIEMALSAAEAFEDQQPHFAPKPLSAGERAKRYRDKKRHTGVTESDAAESGVTKAVSPRDAEKPLVPSVSPKPPSTTLSPESLLRPLKGAHGSRDDELFAMFGESAAEASRSLVPVLTLVAKSDPLQEAFDAFNAVAREFDLPVPNALTDERRRKLKARLDRGSAARWYRALAILRESRWAHGFNDKGWQATFDFLLNENNLNKVLDGNYLRLKPLETIGGKPQRTKLDERHDNFRRAVTATSLTTGRQPA